MFSCKRGLLGRLCVRVFGEPFERFAARRLIEGPASPGDGLGRFLRFVLNDSSSGGGPGNSVELLDEQGGSGRKAGDGQVR